MLLRALTQRSPRPARVAALLLATVGAASSGALPADPLETRPRPVADHEQDAGAAADPVVVPAYRQANTIAILTVRGVIDGITLHSLERRLRRALDEGAEAIVLEIDTPGGEMLATLDICSLLKDPTETPPNTVAWIRPKAYSAGTIIALACREILVAPNASFGDAAPIQGVPGMGIVPMQAAERAKMESPLLGEVIGSARRNHYDENLVQAFVSVGVELWLLENTRTGERIFVDRTEYVRVFGTDPPTQLTTVSPPSSLPARPVSPMFDTMIPQTPADAGLTDPEQQRLALEYAVSRPPSRRPLTEADRDDWRLRRQVISNERLLTVQAAEAVFYGLATRTVANESELKGYFGARTVIRLDRTWSEGLVRILVSWPVRIVLIVIFLIALFIELAAPGMGVFGATAGAALLVLIGAPYLAGMAQWWEIALIVVGLGLLAAEIFVIPGLGVAGIGGVLCLLVGLVGTFVSRDLGTTQGQSELWTGLGATIMATFAALVGMWLISRHLHSLPLLDRLILKAELRHSDGVDRATTGLLEAMGPAGRAALEPGDCGVAETDLRPAGRAEFAGHLLDVKSVGSFIERGKPVRVVSVGRFVIEVEEVTS